MTMTTENARKPETRIREEIPERYTWDLSHIYVDVASWEADLEKLQELIEAYRSSKAPFPRAPSAS
jgi:oligoendopeptidase F